MALRQSSTEAARKPFAGGPSGVGDADVHRSKFGDNRFHEAANRIRAGNVERLAQHLDVVLFANRSCSGFKRGGIAGAHRYTAAFGREGLGRGPSDSLA